MIIHQAHFINSSDDIELNIKRENKLEYNISYDDSKEMRAIVCIIPGFGEDVQSDYKKHLAQSVCEAYNAVVLSVEYHCIGSRLNNGAKIIFNDIDKFVLEHSCKAFNIEQNFNEISYDDLKYIDEQLSKQKAIGKIQNEVKMQLSATFKPSKDEYQNFGIMQAIDIANAILDVKKTWPNIPVVLIGSSHGGYLANLCAKISPWLIDALIDNSSYALTPLAYLGFAKEIDYTKYYEFHLMYSRNIDLFIFTKSFWTSNQYSPFYFSNARKFIRDICNHEHLKLQASYKKIPYICYHGLYDMIAPFKDKEELYKALSELGFKACLYKIASQDQIDGRFIKNLDHGLGMSIKTLIKKHLTQLLNEISLNDIYKKEISYKSDNLIYTFKEQNHQILLSIEKTNN